MSLYKFASQRSLLNCKITLISGSNLFIMNKVHKVDYRLGDYIILYGDASPDEDGTIRSRRIAVSPQMIEAESDYEPVCFTCFHEDCQVNVEEATDKKIYNRY